MFDIVIGYFNKQAVCFDEVDLAYRLKESFYGAKLSKGEDIAVRELKETE